jgi:hypothetical protein
MTYFPLFQKNDEMKSIQKVTGTKKKKGISSFMIINKKKKGREKKSLAPMRLSLCRSH